MLTAKIDASTLKDCIDSLTAIVDEARVKITDEGIRLRAVDPANVAMVSFEMDRDAFEEFTLEATGEEKEIEIGIDLLKLSGIIEMGGREMAEIELEEGKQKLFIKMGSLSYTVSLLDPSTIRKEPKVPELDLPVRVVIETSEFRRAIKAAERIGEHMVIGVDGDVFIMETEGEMDKVKFSLEKEQLIDLTPGVVQSLYSLEYISAMSKGMSKAYNVCISLGKDYPLKMDFELADGKARVSYLLAPRIESE